MILFLIPILIFGIIILFSGIFTVKQQTAAIVERFGKFQSIRNSGLHFKIPFFDSVYKVKVDYQWKEEFGFRTRKPGVRSSYSQRGLENESWMLTGNLKIAGKFTDETGGMYMLLANNDDEAHNFAKNDPYYINNLINENKNLQTQLFHSFDLIGVSQNIQTIKEQIEKLSFSESRVFINGPTGSGKELIARKIHKNSKLSKSFFLRA